MNEERKTLEQREEMTDLDRLRHSASHVLATAILKIWPEAQFAAGPPVENGFYYDVDLPHRISPDERSQCLLQRRREESSASTRLWYCLPDEKGARRLLRHARGSKEARPS